MTYSTPHGLLKKVSSFSFVLLATGALFACTSQGGEPLLDTGDASSPEVDALSPTGDVAVPGKGDDPLADAQRVADVLEDGQSTDAFGDSDTTSTVPVVDPTCETDGCLRGVEAFGTFSRADLEPFLAPGVILENGYSVFRVRYFTNGREGRATFTVPDLEAPSAEGYAVGVNNPGTVGIADACAVGESVAGSGLAGYFGGRGLFGVAVDYPGLATSGSHPYLVLEVEGRASLDAVRAALNFAHIEDIPTSGRAVIAGLSQGGHATFAAAGEHLDYAPELDLRAFAVASPASVFLEHWSSGATVSGPHLVFHALLVHAYAVHYDHNAGSLWADGIANEIEAILESHCLFSVGGPSLFDLIPEDPEALFHPDFLAAYRSGDLSAYPALETAFATNRVRSFTQSAPFRVYQGVDDDVVLKIHTDQLVEELRAGGLELEYIPVAGGGHTDVAFSFLAQSQLRTEEAIAWLKAALE